MAPPKYPSLYQINTRVWLTEMSQRLGRPATLDDIPDADIRQWSELGFDWIWLLSVWETGEAGRRVSRTNPEWHKEFQDTLPDLRDEDIPGSGFAITGYTVHEQLGGDGTLVRLRERLRRHGLRLMLDFVPNHTGIDHPWVEDHAEYYITGTDADLAREPKNFVRAPHGGGELILAHGRDPYFPGWPDTVQLNYGNPDLQEAMIGELDKIAKRCDGVRCDMAMLVLPEIFERTWGIGCMPFWPEATRRVRERSPEFVFMAEVYWDLEWTLQQQGFDYTYDKRLYDRLREDHERPVREHFWAGLDYQDKMARFLENHDEPRAAAVFSEGIHEAAATITFLSPGLRFFHQGQFEGRTKRISPHLGRAPSEPVNPRLAGFYSKLLGILRESAFRAGRWQLLECAPAWEGNWTSDCLVAFSWEGTRGDRFVVAVNYAPNQSQCYVRLPFADLAGKTWRLRDRLSVAVYDRDGGPLQSAGLFLDMGPWQAAVYSWSPAF